MSTESDVFAGIRIAPRKGMIHPRPPEMVAHQVAKAQRAQKSPKGTHSRFLLEALAGRPAYMPAHDAAFIIEGRTKYPTTRTSPDSEPVLKSGAHQAKIGGIVRKGKWRGMPIYCLTLEERVTCPTDCGLWRACYGNNMHFARRFRHGAELEAILEREVAARAAVHPGGFVLRLHILGDFYSAEYVDLWAQLLHRHPELRVFGYTARWRRHDPIAVALIQLAMANWDRFALRFSNAPIDTASTITIEHVAQKPADAIICPAQLGKTESCSTCALCWQTDRRIAFIRH